MFADGIGRVVDGELVAVFPRVLVRRDDQVVDGDSVVEVEPGVVVENLAGGVGWVLFGDVAKGPAVAHHRELTRHPQEAMHAEPVDALLLLALLGDDLGDEEPVVVGL